MAFTAQIVGEAKISAASAKRRQSWASLVSLQMFRRMNIQCDPQTSPHFPPLSAMFALLCLPLEVCVWSQLSSLWRHVFALFCFTLKDYLQF